MGTQIEDYSNLFISKVLPFFCQNFKFSEKEPHTQSDTHALWSTPFKLLVTIQVPINMLISFNGEQPYNYIYQLVFILGKKIQQFYLTFLRNL